MTNNQLIDKLLSDLVSIKVMTSEQVTLLESFLQKSSPISHTELIEELKKQHLLTTWQADQVAHGRMDFLRYGEFILTDFIHRSSFSRIFKARSIRDSHQVALKVLTSKAQADTRCVARLKQELESSKAVGSLWVPQCESIEEFQNRNCLIREWINGKTVRQYVTERGRIEGPRAENLMIQLAQGLVAFRNAGLTHGAINAHHILLRPDLQPVWIDLSWTQNLTSSTQLNEQFPGTSEFERATRVPAGDKRTDAYFLGCLYYELLSGMPPFPELEDPEQLRSSIKRTFGTEVALDQISNPPIQPICKTVSKMMDLNAERRLAEPQKILNRLQRIQQNLDPDSPTAEDPSSFYDTAELYKWLSGTATPVSSHEIKVIRLDEPRQDVRPINLTNKISSTVLCVEAQEEIQAELRKTFDKLGWKSRMVRTSDTALDMVRENAPQMIVFDTDGQGREALDNFLEIDRISSLGREAPKGLLLLGPKHAKLENTLPANIHERYEILHKPLRMRDVKTSLMSCAIHH